jgi:hypothetical protein
MSKTKKPAINISVGGQDCTGNGKWSAKDLRIVSNVFWQASEALEKKEHGCVEDEMELASIGIDFGLDFDEENGLPRLETRCNEGKGGGGRLCYLSLGHKGSHAFQCGK